MRIVYLHGFASGPGSRKGRYFARRLAELGIALALPDLNAPTFENLTLSTQLAVIDRTLADTAGPVTLIGSSLGGLLAVLQAIRDRRVERLVLLAPAFRFVERWSARLGDERIKQWRSRGTLPVYHYGFREERALGIAFLDDAARYDEEQLVRPLPTLLLHGRQDEVIAPASSIAFAASRPWVTLQLLDTDHGMESALDILWQQTAAFLDLAP